MNFLTRVRWWLNVGPAFFNRYTDRARKALVLANERARQEGAEAIEARHMLLGILEEGTGLGVFLLTRMGIDLKALATELGKPASGPTPDVNRLPLAASAASAIRRAGTESRRLRHWHVGTEHLMLGLLYTSPTLCPRCSHGQACQDVATWQYP